MANILLVDDDPHILEVIAFALEKAGHEYKAAPSGSEALDLFEQHNFDLIILDVGLPDFDGLEVCRRIRMNSETPILFLSARDEEIDRILGLEIGGDDYVTKPFSPRELTARISAILNRVGNQKSSVEEENLCLNHGLLALDSEKHSVHFDNKAVTMTALEFSILTSFAQRPGIVFNRNQILDQAYPDNLNVSDRTIDSHIRNIRAKLRAVGCEHSIETVHGVGFRLGSCR